MKRYVLLTIGLVALGLIWLPLAVEAQQSTKLPRLGFIGNQSASWPPYQAFWQTLQELGYVEGKNIAIEARFADGNFDRLLSLRTNLSVSMLTCCMSRATKA